MAISREIIIIMAISNCRAERGVISMPSGARRYLLFFWFQFHVVLFSFGDVFFMATAPFRFLVFSCFRLVFGRGSSRELRGLFLS